jgi:hypothetical protein
MTNEYLGFEERRAGRTLHKVILHVFWKEVYGESVEERRRTLIYPPNVTRSDGERRVEQLQAIYVIKGSQSSDHTTVSGVFLAKLRGQLTHPINLPRFR